MQEIRIGEVIIYVKNGSKAQGRLLLALEMIEHSFVVQSSQREVFMTPFVRMLKEDKQQYNLQGPRQLAKLLSVMADFRNGDNEKTSVKWETIEKEIVTIRKKLYPDD